MKLLSFCNTLYRKTACGPNAKARKQFFPLALHIYTFCNSLNQSI